MPRNQTPRQFLDQLASRPGSLASRGGGRAPAREGMKDIFRQKMDATSAENQSRLERERSLLARKMEEIRNTTHPVNDPAPQPNESEES